MPGSHKLHRIFVVDDEPVIASTLATILCKHGFDATSFSKPLEALLASRSEAPDLLISDVVMPSLSGIELAIQVREALAGLQSPSLFRTSSHNRFSRERAQDGHHFEVLTKPVHPAELLRKIQSLTDKAPGGPR